MVCWIYVCRKPLRDESHEVFCRGLPLLVLVRQFVDETRLYPYRVQVRAPSSSCFESFVEEFLWIGSAHRQKTPFDIGDRPTLPDCFKIGQSDENRKKFYLGIGLDKLLDPLVTLFHIRFDMNNVISVGEQSKMCRFNTTPVMTEMV